MAKDTVKSYRKAEQRVELAGAALDRLSVGRELLRMERVETRMALTLQLLERVADDVAELAARP